MSTFDALRCPHVGQGERCEHFDPSAVAIRSRYTYGFNEKVHMA